ALGIEDADFALRPDHAARQAQRRTGLAAAWATEQLDQQMCAGAGRRSNVEMFVADMGPLWLGAVLGGARYAQIVRDRLLSGVSDDELAAVAAVLQLKDRPRRQANTK